MLRKSRIADELRKQCESIKVKDIANGVEGCSAAQIAKQLNLDRANVSKELNRLLEEKRVVKITGRPVYYFDVQVLESLLFIHIQTYEVATLKTFLQETNKEDDFMHIIGSEGSLKTDIQKAKAAMIYPPFGLHTLLIGPTGSGKTMFAEIMYRYAKSHGVLEQDAEFIVFNCAEYADNPQLLLAQLFGYAKGAYTGAMKESLGLVGKANGGILFLDEIHRLPAEGQEMLFMVLDKGCYRRLGEDTLRKVNLLMIGATTENVDSALLQTFLRRIPMTITLPSLQERPLKERLELIEKFFRQEYGQVQLPIYVKRKIMDALLAYACAGNIGQLKADIRLICARGFLECIANGENRIKITTSLLPEQLYNGLFNTQRHEEIASILDLKQEEYLVFDKEAMIEAFDHQDQEDVYEIIDRQYELYEKQGCSDEEINRQIKRYIEDYIAHLLDRMVKNGDGGNEELFKIVHPSVYKAVETAISLAESKLNKKLPKNIYIALALHVSAIMENKLRHPLKQSAYHIALEHPNEFQVAKSMKHFLQSELDIELPQQETIFLTMFLLMENHELENKKIGLLVLAHGNGVARNMVDAANTLMRSTHAHALDMPLKQNVEAFLTIVTEKVVQINEGKGVLLLVDMGSLLSFGEIIEEKTGIKVKTIDMVSTPFVLEASRKTMLPEQTLDQVYEEMKTYIPYIGRTYAKDIKQKMDHDLVIITTCITGEGAAIKLGELIRSAVALIDEYHIEILSCNADSFSSLPLEGKRVLAVVGAIDLPIPDTTYISNDRLILGDGLTTLSHLIINVTGAENVKPQLPNFVINNLLTDSLVFLDPMKANDAITKSFQIINNMMEIMDYNRILIGYLLHLGCMIERIIQKQAMAYSEEEKRIKADEKRYRIIRTAMEIIESTFNITVPDGEVCYIMDIFDTD
ncbi:sigma 54-interacting transcriptional regulator [Massilicoli timonensis]|uniref:sigma 54-interacting transcriptional regulator n=1 Tax=Massilicoli timonensis TaxID=2015901 RepID=UPI000C824C7D|nr:sigma-54-dependent transcriptional regulator [Massilicoli timonensis]